MRSPRISVLLPVYNGARYLEAALSSVFAQSCSDFELIVIDDGSTDETPLLLARVKDPRLSVIRQDNRGIVAALNAGLAAARGSYLARMDADDEILPQRLATQLRFLEGHPDVVVCGMQVERFGAATGRIALPASDAACRARLLFGSCFVHPAVMMRGDVVRTHSVRYRADALYAEDYRMWLDLAGLGKLVNLDEVGLRYRVHSGQTGQEKRQAQREAHARVMSQAWSSFGVSLTPDEAVALLWPQGHGAAAALRYLRQQSGILGRALYGLKGGRLRACYRVAWNALAIVRGLHVH
ncbi:glycosyltransferase family 2 protein [Chitinibacteraceae bacterium HSL-7]